MSKPVSQEIFHLMRKAFQMHTATWQKEMPDVTKPQAAVLRTLQECPGIEQVELMSAAVSSKATLAEMLRRLELRKLVYRQPDPDDKRRRFVFLTEQGEQLVKQLEPKWEYVDQLFLHQLSASDQEQLLTLLAKLIHREGR